ncbi:MAG: GGDEF domain-containing protein [Desulfosalsimonas sp.]
MNPVFKIIPDNDPRQALRLRRFFMALGTYFLWLFLIIYCHALDFIRLNPSQTAFIYSIFILANIIFYILIRTGFNTRFKDPSMTLAQMVTGTVAAMIIIYFTDRIRALMIFIYFVTFIFGIFRFNIRQYFSFALFSMGSYGLMVLLLFYNHPERVDPAIEILQFIILGAVLFWFSLICGYISTLRDRLSTANKELTSALETIEVIAVHDDLTNTYNRRQMFHELDRSKNIADRTGVQFAIILFDLDHFKRVNDNYGHQKGDYILRHMISELRSELRQTDIIARYGGEEFLVIMVDSNIDGAGECAERLRKKAEKIKYSGFSDSFQVTISIGITMYCPSENVDELIKRADNALYLAKAEGRNRVVAQLPESKQKVNYERSPGG